MSSGVGEVTYLWTFNNTDISQLDQFTNRTSRLSFGSQLVITDLRLEDSGQIGCEASNNLSVSRHLADLSVTRAGLERKVSLGEKTSLACPLGGDSEAVISWLRDSKLVSSHPVLADGSLLIKAVAPSDLGEYLCQADHLRLGEQGRPESNQSISILSNFFSFSAKLSIIGCILFLVMIEKKNQRGLF